MKWKYDNENILVGVISDTHGYLSDAVKIVFKDVKLIVHAGDIDAPPVLNKLKSIAPVIAVRGNMDAGEWTNDIPLTELIEIGRHLIYVLHDRIRIDIEPEAMGLSAVISGHSHRPSLEKRNGVFFLNPGSASYPRFNHLGSLALLKFSETDMDIEFVDIK